MIANIVLVLVARAFAWSMGAHYTGACMGMSYATGSISLRPALVLMAVMTLLGASFLSHKVLAQIGEGLITGRLGRIAAIIVIGIAFLLTTIFTWWRVPTSTIQILVFTLAGTASALGLGLHWSVIARLVLLWIGAPILACGLGFLFTGCSISPPTLPSAAPAWRAGGG